MIPILYAGNEKDFLNNGLGRLSDAIKCTVEEERNGIYELEMTYPITGVHYADIQENNIIYAPSEDGGVNQAFIIYKISKPINGIVTINAQHISYLLNGFIVMPYTATSIADALNKINANAVPETGFTFSTDILLSKPFKLDTPRSIRSLLGGESGSLLDVYGGHDYYFNNFTVSLLADRGHDNGVTIRYGKNLTDLNAVSNTTNVYTGIVPYWMDSETSTIVFVDDYVVYSEHAATYPYKYIKCVDFSMDFEEAPSKAQLFARAESYLASNDGWKIKNNIEVSFVSLADTEEYKNIAPLERVKLCDTVTVEYSKLGISFKTKVIRTVYNVLLNRYDSIELGDTTYTLAQAISQANDTPTLQETTSAIQSAVQNATKLIRGGYGGHIVMMANANGLPEEILVMDTEDITTAEKVWRWNLNGFGYSDDGYDGPYGTAITMDGQIVANFITAGVLNAGILKAGIISDEMGLNSWNLETGELHLSALQHEYLGDVFGDITLWHNDDGNTPFSYETIDGVKYFVIDGTNVATWGDFNSGVYTPITLSGDNAISVHFVYYIDTPVTTTAAEKLPVIRYKRVGSSGYYHNTISFPAQSIPANTEFTWDVTMHPTNTDASEQAYFGFLPILGTKMYFKEISISTSIDSYASAGLEFNAEGLTSTVRKDEVISSINQSAEAVTINANRIDLTGNLNLHGTFTTDESADPNLQGYYSKYEASSLQFYNDLDQLMMEIKPGYINGTPQFGIFFYTYNGQSVTFTAITDKTAVFNDVLLTGDFDITNTGANTMHVPVPAEFWGTTQFYGDVLNFAGSQVFVSDQRKKRNIEDLVLNKARSFIMALKPRKFKFIEDISKSNRFHHGFIAQEVRDAMPEDWGIYTEDKKQDFIGLRYDEFLADIVAVIQDQEKRIEALERAIHDKSNN